MATIYMDPANTFDGDGTTGYPATSAGGVGARNKVTVSTFVGNTYLQRVGWDHRHTSSTTSNIYCLNLIGTVASPTVFGTYSLPGDTETWAYLDGSALSSISNRGVIDINGCSHVKISGFRIFGAGKTSTTAGAADYADRYSNLMGGIVLTRPNYVEVSNCELYDNACGISVWLAGTAGIYKGINIHNNNIHANCRAGVMISFGGTQAAPTLAATDGLRIVNNRVSRTGVLKWDPAAHGIGTDTKSPWYNSSITGPTGGICFYSGWRSCFKYDADELCTNTLIAGNILTDNMGYGIYSRALGAGSKIVNNTVSGTGIDFNGTTFLTETYDTHPIWVAGCEDTVVEYNEVFNNAGGHGTDYGTGVGIFLDINLTDTYGSVPRYVHPGKRNIVRWNYVHDNYHGSANGGLPSSGIMVYCNDDSQIYGNIVSKCRNGVTVSGGTWYDSANASNAAKVTALSGDGVTSLVTTFGNHGLSVGDVIAPGYSTPMTFYVGSAVVLSVPALNQYTYASSGTGSATVLPTDTKYVMQSKNMQIENNTIIDTSEVALASFIYAKENLFRNNLVINARWGVLSSTTGSALKMSNPTVDANCFYGVTSIVNVGGDYTASALNAAGADQPAFTDLGALPLTNIYSNPLLNTSTFRVPPASPAVGAGIPMKNGRRGYDGQRFRAKPTIGAIETAARVVVAQKAWPRP